MAFAAAVVAGAAALVWGPPTRLPKPLAPEIVAVKPAAPPPVAPKPVIPKPAPAPAPAPAPIVASVAPVPAPLPPVREVEPATMSPALEAALDNWLISTYRQCWKSPAAPPEGEPYFPKIRVAFKADGGLRSAPKLINPPSDPAWKPQAEAALRAVKACDPLRVPDKYAPFYQQWKTKTVYFDTARS